MNAPERSGAFLRCETPAMSKLFVMAAELRLQGRTIASVFELIGDRENDITYSIGWAMSQCPLFRARVIGEILPEFASAMTDSILLQERGEGGITDIEVKGPAVHIILEAKRGFEVPTLEQLTRYAGRLANSPRPGKAIVSVSESSRDFASTRLPAQVAGQRCCHMSFADIDRLARQREGTHAEKRLLAELSTYLNRIARMQDVTSNIVYVVALSDDCPEKSTVTWREMVEGHGMYIHPVGNSFPREPVNYVGFRYGGQLRSIRHVERYEIIDGVFDRIPGCRYEMECPYYLYHLGPAVLPSKVVKNGKVTMANRVYAAIDLLLTCDTISEAGELTRQRVGE